MNYDYGDNKQKTISFRITCPMYDSISSISESYGLSVSEFMRLLIETFIYSIDKGGK